MAKYDQVAASTEMRLLVGERITQGVRELVKLHRKIRSIQEATGDITFEMIQAAKDYPFEELYPFKRGMARCPFHYDKTPSMSLKDNRVRCWSCMEKSMDTIEFTRKLEGLSFKEAVRRLNA
jgi:hypothetical protein